MEIITYRTSKNFTDAELLEYITSSAFWIGDEEEARERVRQVREYTEILLEKEEKTKNISAFRRFKKANLTYYYEEVINYCSAHNFYCPCLLFQDVEATSAESGCLCMPFEISLEEIISAIEKNSEGNSEGCGGNKEIFLHMYSITLDICRSLGIESPYIRPINITFKGGWVPSEDTVYIDVNLLLGSRENLMATLAHELRHKWQTLSGVYVDNSNYYANTELECDIRSGYDNEVSQRNYYLQECEIDANAYAYAYGINSGYDKQVMEQIMKRKGIAYEKIMEHALRIGKSLWS